MNLAVLIVARHATLETPFARHALHAGLPVFILPERRRFDPLTIRHLREICTRWQPDIVQTHAVKSHALVWCSGLRRRHTWIAFHHGYTSPDVRMRVYNALDRITLRHAHHVVTVAEAFRRELLRSGVEGSRLSVLHNAAPACSPENRCAAEVLRVHLKLGHDTRVVAAIGRLSFEKGHTHLIRAFAKVRAQVPDLHLVIVGEGPERARLQREVVGLGLQRQVTLLEAQEDVSPVYQLADVVALPSITEGSPNVLLEAMAAGVPVVATRAGGIPEVVTDEQTALLVSPGDVEEMAQAIYRLLRSPSLAMRLAGGARRLAVERHDSVRRAATLLSIYGRVLGNAAGEAVACASRPCAF